MNNNCNDYKNHPMNDREKQKEFEKLLEKEEYYYDWWIVKKLVGYKYSHVNELFEDYLKGYYPYKEVSEATEVIIKKLNSKAYEHEETAAQLRRIATLYSKGLGSAQIEKELGTNLQ